VRNSIIDVELAREPIVLNEERMLFKAKTLGRRATEVVTE